MISIVLATLMMGDGALTPSAALPDPCELLTPAQISSAFGKAPAKAERKKPERDEETKSDSWICTMEVGEELLMISVSEFPAAAAAGTVFTGVVKTHNEDLEVKMTIESGLGDRSAWAARPDAIWVAIKGKYMLMLHVATANGDGTRHREPLKRLAAAALTKL
jgi:hypothetical protein